VLFETVGVDAIRSALFEALRERRDDPAGASP